MKGQIPFLAVSGPVVVSPALIHLAAPLMPRLLPWALTGRPAGLLSWQGDLERCGRTR